MKSDVEYYHDSSEGGIWFECNSSAGQRLVTNLCRSAGAVDCGINRTQAAGMIRVIRQQGLSVRRRPAASKTKPASVLGSNKTLVEYFEGLHGISFCPMSPESLNAVRESAKRARLRTTCLTRSKAEKLRRVLENDGFTVRWKVLEKPKKSPGEKPIGGNTGMTLRCPKCRSSSFTSNKKGFGLGKAITGGVLLGGVGLLGGFVGSDKVQVTCLHCGHQWKAGQRK